MVVLNSHKLITEAFVRRGDEFSDRSDLNAMGANYSDGMLMLSQIIIVFVIGGLSGCDNKYVNLMNAAFYSLGIGHIYTEQIYFNISQQRGIFIN